MLWTEWDDILKREQDLEEISRLLYSELPLIRYISDSVRNIAEADKNSSTSWIL